MPWGGLGSEAELKVESSLSWRCGSHVNSWAPWPLHVSLAATDWSFYVNTSSKSVRTILAQFVSQLLFPWESLYGTKYVLYLSRILKGSSMSPVAPRSPDEFGSLWCTKTLGSENPLTADEQKGKDPLGVRVPDLA